MAFWASYPFNIAQLIRSGDQRLPHHQVPDSTTWGKTAMRVYDRYWLDHDSVTFAVLVIALGILELIVLGI